MKRNILTLAIIVVSLFSISIQLKAESVNDIPSFDIQNITISVVESTVHVVGAQGKVLQIFNVTGVKVFSVKIQDTDKFIDLNLPKGCYIIKVGKMVRKISIK